MRKIIIFVIVLFSMISCKTNQTINKKREGRWIENYYLDSTKYKSVGYYKNDDPIKKWKYYLNNKLIKKDFCKTKFFYENRKLESKGKTQLDQNTKKLHWYYTGIWKYYNQQGKLTTIKKYNKGEFISEHTIKNNL